MAHPMLCSGPKPLLDFVESRNDQTTGKKPNPRTSSEAGSTNDHAVRFSGSARRQAGGRGRPRATAAMAQDRALSAATAAWPSVFFGLPRPSSEVAMALPTAVEIAVYCTTAGRMWRAFERFLTNR